MTMMLDERPAKRQKLVQESCTDIPDDLVIEILCRLPHYKHVFRCMFISKHWFSLISNPDFIRHYITHRWLSSPELAEQPWAFMYLNLLDTSFRDLKYYKTPPTFNLISKFSKFKFPRPPYEDEPITIVKAFNDLILCCAEKFDRSECIYYICNQQTKQWVTLPPTPPPPANLRCSGVEFMCEPYYKIDEHGMVILNTHFKFKVFRFFNLEFSIETNLKLQVFSSESGTWNLTEISLPIDAISPITRSLVCNDKLILISRNKRNHGLSFITIDDDHCESLFEFPGNMFCMDPYRSIIHVSSSRQGNLRIAQIILNYIGGHGYDNPYLTILEHVKDIRKWKLPHVATFRSITSTDGWISNYLENTSFIRRGKNGQQRICMPTILGFHPFDDNLLYLNLNSPGEQMACYNIRERSLTSVKEDFSYNFPSYGLSTRRWWWCDVSQLVLPLWPTPLPQSHRQLLHQNND